MLPSQLPAAKCTSDACHGLTSASTQRKRALRAPSSTSASSRSSAALFSASVARSWAKRAERTPGRPPKASTSSPLSSARASVRVALAIARALISALSSKVAPSSTMFGCSPSTSAAERSCTGKSASSARSSRSLPWFEVARTIVSSSSMVQSLAPEQIEMAAERERGPAVRVSLPIARLVVNSCVVDALDRAELAEADGRQRRKRDHAIQAKVRAEAEPRFERRVRELDLVTAVVDGARAAVADGQLGDEAEPVGIGRRAHARAPKIGVAVVGLSVQVIRPRAAVAIAEPGAFPKREHRVVAGQTRSGVQLEHRP